MRTYYSSPLKLPLFSAFGVELECMIVDQKSLNVKSIADRLLFAIAKEQVSDVNLGKVELSNELVLHVIELKCSNPAPNLFDLPEAFQQGIKHINEALLPFNACLLPTGMHPWMNPVKETKLWPHAHSPVYEAYNRIFNCSGHGWANLQSLHLNLPFADDAEFAKLHTAIRLLLPIIPALSASSPLRDGVKAEFLDERLEIYRNNQKIIPSIAGKIIPECVLSKEEYEQRILQPMYREIAPYDSDGILQHEWLNSRGAIARFDRNTVEIRIIDAQECPLVDIAILCFVVEVLKELIAEKWLNFREQQTLLTDNLALIFNDVVKSGRNSVIDDLQYLNVFGYKNNKCTVGELWQHIFSVVETPNLGVSTVEVIKNILNYGSLSERILRALNNDFSSQNLHNVYHTLSECLVQGKMFM